jgi:hypothetical protein
MNVAPIQPGKLPPPFSFRERLREISMFFDKTDKVHQAMRRVCERLNQAGIQPDRTRRLRSSSGRITRRQPANDWRGNAYGELLRLEYRFKAGKHGLKTFHFH